METIKPPESIAYFTVSVPMTVEIEQARSVVDRYLYSGQVVEEDHDRDFTTYLFLIMVRSGRSRYDLESQVQQQRDRFASGLYATSEPTLYVRLGA